MNHRCRGAAGEGHQGYGDIIWETEGWRGWWRGVVALVAEPVDDMLCQLLLLAGHYWVVLFHTIAYLSIPERVAACLIFGTMSTI